MAGGIEKQLKINKWDRESHARHSAHELNCWQVDVISSLRTHVYKVRQLTTGIKTDMSNTWHNVGMFDDTELNC